MNGKIIVKPDALSGDYLPKRLLRREKESQQLKDNIQNKVNTMIFGPAGSGKTAIIKRAINGSGEDIRYVDCTLYDTPFSVLKEILPSAKLILQRSIYELIKKLAKEASQKQLGICFDNFARLKDPNIITKVISLGVNVILASNADRDVNVLNTNALSNIPSVIQLSNYTIEQAFNILKERAQEALARQSFTDELLMEIAERSRGNMTLAINVLRTAALKAQEANKRKIEVTDLTETLCISSNPANLGEDEMILLEIVREKRRLPSGDLFTMYREKVTASKGKRSFRNYMTKLCAKGFVRATGTNRWRVYELVRSDDGTVFESSER